MPQRKYCLSYADLELIIEYFRHSFIHSFKVSVGYMLGSRYCLDTVYTPVSRTENVSTFVNFVF